VAGGKTSQVWEEVRRALGRLASRTTVHEIAPQWSVPAVVKRSDATVTLAATAGAWEGNWRPQADTVAWPIPSAEEGGLGADLASVATVVSMNAALAAEAAPICCPPWRLEGSQVQAWDRHQAVLASPEVAAPSVRFGQLKVQAAALALTAGDVHLVPVPCLAPARWRKAESALAWALAPPRMRSDLRILARVPIFRESAAAHAGQAPTEAFASERRHLAASAGIEESDVLLLGVFPQVPLAMVEKLIIAGESRTRLQIWLKSSALAAGPKGVKLATIILGRQRSTGRALQAVSRTPAPSFGKR
jgi:hypothetical protein